MRNRTVPSCVLLAVLVACTASGDAPTSPPAPTVASVEVAPAMRTITVGTTATLTATLRDADGNPLSGQTIAWNSANASIATVSDAGVVTGVGAGGPVAISASAAGKTGTAMVTVTPPPVATVTVNAPGTTLEVGSTMQLSAETRVAGGQVVTGRAITWSTSNSDIATVSATGFVTAVSPGGPVTITATSEGKQGTAALTVTLPPVTSVTVTAPSNTLHMGSSMQLAAETRIAGGTIVTGRTVTWSTSDESIATVNATGLVTAVALGGPVTITASSEGIEGSAAVTVVLPPLAAGWQYRRQITISAGADAIEEGYSIPITIDHQAMVAAGKSLAAGNDVRIAAWDGSTWAEHDLVLDVASAWNTNDTRVWFRIDAPIAANGQNVTYYLHYGNAAAGNDAARNPDEVFLHFDDFESGTLAKWFDDDGTWSNVDTRARSGIRSMWHGAESANGRRIVANPALDVRNVMVEAWWNVTSLHIGFNTSQMPRFRQGTGMYYTLFCQCIGADMGFNIASNINGNYTDLTVPGGNPTANTWIRVGTAMHGDTYHLFVGGSLVTTQANLSAIMSGNIGFDKFIIPSGNGVWIDDVVVRRYVFPEPTAVVGAEIGVSAVAGAVRQDGVAVLNRARR